MDIILERKRIDFIDAAKGLAILLVVLGHLVSLDSLLEKVIYSFHIPFFFLMSGAFSHPEKQRFGDYLKKNARRLIVPYVIFYLIGSLVTVCVPFFRGVTFRDIIYGFFFDPGLVNVGATWFLTCLFFASILFYPLYKLLLSKKIMILSFIVLVGLMISPLIINRLRIEIPFRINTSISALPMYSLGYLFKEKIFAISRIVEKKILCTVVFFSCSLVVILIPLKNGLVAVVNNKYGNDYLLYFFSAICGSVLLLIVGSVLEKSKLLRFIGKNSLMFFSLQFILINSYSFVLSRITGTAKICQNNLNVYEILIGLVCITSILFVFVYGYNRIKKRMTNIMKRQK